MSKNCSSAKTGISGGDCKPDAKCESDRTKHQTPAPPAGSLVSVVYAKLVFVAYAHRRPSTTVAELGRRETATQPGNRKETL